MIGTVMSRPVLASISGAGVPAGAVGAGCWDRRMDLDPARTANHPNATPPGPERLGPPGAQLGSVLAEARRPTTTSEPTDS